MGPVIRHIEILLPSEADPVPDIISGPTLTKISRVSGKDATQFDWQSNVPFQSYKIKIVPGPTSPHSAGTLVEQDENPSSGGSALTTYTATLTDDEAVAASAGEGANIIKIFVQNIGGTWSL